jgi:hypothetical protein
MNTQCALILRESFLSTGCSSFTGGPVENNVRKPLDYHRNIILRDEKPASIRPIYSTDKNSLVSFYTRLSEETRFLRFHYSKGDLTDSDLKLFCDLDYQNTLALVVESEQEGQRQIIGVGRYTRLPIDHTAEVAFVVQDSEQNKGVGTHLLYHLAILAWQRDIYFFFGEVLRQNSKMLSIFRKSDPKMKQEVDSPTTCTVTISVVEALRPKH